MRARWTTCAQIRTLHLGLGKRFVYSFHAYNFAYKTIRLMDFSNLVLRPLIFVCAFALSSLAFAEQDETRTTPAWDWDLFDGVGWTPRYTYLYKDNVIGIAHYAGLSYFNKEGAQMTGATFRYGHGSKGHKYNVAYTNSTWHWGVDFGFSWHVLDAGNFTIPDPNGIEQLGLELSVRYRVVSITATHTEGYSWATLGLNLEGLPFLEGW